MKWMKYVSAVRIFSVKPLAKEIGVVNSGHPGWNSRQLREILGTELAENRPDVVVLMAGTNDNLNSYNLTPPAEYRENLEIMVRAAQASGAEVLLCEIPNACEELMRKRHKPDFFGSETAACKVKRANEAVAAVAASCKVPLLKTTEVLGAATADAASLFRNPANSKNEDGVHPTPNGYSRFADAVAKRIRAEKWNPDRILCFGDSITCGVHVKGEGSASPDAETYPGRLFRELNAR